VIRLHNTLSRAVAPLAPANPDGVYRLYCCGPTVYGASHIGNFRTFIIQDVLRRALQIEFGAAKVLHARNITDVDDRILQQARDENRPLADIAAHWSKLFHADAQALNLLPPHFEPGAVETIPAQIALIQRLLDLGHAYKAPDGSVYFKVASFPDYGRLARLEFSALRTQDTNSAGALNLADKYDRDSAADFALWKARKPEDGPNFWPSPFGEGRPGWHIECSAMIEQVFAGQTIDLHGGGVDLIFPHHENEIAQSTCAHDGDASYHFVRHWFHSAHLTIEDHKMARSVGNVYTLAEIQKMGFTPVALRYALLAGHYRSPLNFSQHALQSADAALHKLNKHLLALAARATVGASLATAHSSSVGASLATAHSSSVGASLAPGHSEPTQKATAGPTLLDSKAPGPSSPQPETHSLITRLIAADPANLRWGRFATAWSVLCDDLNLPGALGEIFKVEPKASSAEQAAEDLEGLVKIAVHVLGLDLPLPVVTATIPAAIAALAQQRWDAKKSRDFKLADTLRLQIESAGFKILDRKDGFALEPDAK
jgi:cysteinyl-tRNA synthetase